MSDHAVAELVVVNIKNSGRVRSIGFIGRVRASLPFPVIAYGVIVVCLAASVLLTPLSSTRFGRYTDDIGDVIFALVAAASCGWQARQTRGRYRMVWIFISIACTSWALGEVAWCWVELGLNENPFPSLADVGYLGFPVAACAALIAYPTTERRAGLSRRYLDTAMTIGSMGLISWETVLSAVVRASTGDTLSNVLSIAYPLTDLTVLVLTILTLVHARGGRLSLSLVATGLVALSLSDSLFCYLTASSSYTGGAVDLGWVIAFVLLAQAPFARSDEVAVNRDVSSSRPSRVAYLPLIAAVAVTTALAAAGHRPTAGQLLLMTALVVILLTRQYLTVRENADLTEALARHEDELRYQAFHDSLTGLPNRALFWDRLGHALDLHSRDLRAVSVLFLDLDDFKVINDTLGHACGDELLQRVADRLLGAVRAGDTVARLGGDEFAILLEDSGDAVVVADKVVNALQHPFTIGTSGQRLVRASVGVVVLEAADNPTTADSLVSRADTAMYEAKRAGKGRIALYREGMALREVTDQSLAAALTAAIAGRKIRVAYQPIVDLRTDRTCALEALARWSHDGKEIPPVVFIPLADRLGLIGQLTDVVVSAVCERLAEWSQAIPGRSLTVSINVPPSLVTTPTFVPLVRRYIERYDIRAGQLVVEITESGLFEDIDAARLAIDELHSLGVAIWLDDFGVGYSSLGQLHDIEFDLVKLDRSFVRDLKVGGRQQRFIAGLMRLTAEVGIPVLAEGIENIEQLDHLKRLGCAFGQGYFLSRPIPSARVSAYLSTEAALADHAITP